ncbi:MAG: hypothetical protein LBC65_03895 [Oscillospiraceae bacterium]|jgi:DNA mismatch repair ATPase MutS|nr:hypothetical protein [Oscillospiraceae bacterium]
MSDLLVDRLLTEFEPSPERRAAFLQVLSSRSTAANAIRRQAILRDFLTDRELLDDLREMLTGYDDLRRNWQELRLSLGVYASLKATADFVRSTVSYFKSVHDSLAEHIPESDGLRELQKWLLETSRNDSLDELNRIAELFPLDSPEAYEIEARVQFADDFAVKLASITTIAEIVETPFIRRVFRKKIDDGSVDLGEFHADQSRALLRESMYELYRAMTATAGALYEVFHGISRELDFYTTATLLCDYLHGKGMHFTFPRFSDRIHAAGIFDPLLLAEGLTSAQIVANSSDFPALRGVLIRGENAAGKTSFIRAIGLLSIFASAGLPVCAQTAEVPYFGYVHSQFSKAEQLGKLDEAGRFEQEVAELAGIYAHIGKAELLLLNETFQTTSYAEGAEAIRHILSAIERRGASWIFVTHLSPLLQDPPPEAELITMEDYSYGNK